MLRDAELLRRILSLKLRTRLLAHSLGFYTSDGYFSVSLAYIKFFEAHLVPINLLLIKQVLLPRWLAFLIN